MPVPCWSQAAIVAQLLARHPALRHDRLQTAGFVASLVCLGELSFIAAHNNFGQPDHAKVLPGVHMFMMWQLRAYLRAVAAGEVAPVHGPHSPPTNHKRVFRTVWERVNKLMSTWPAPQQVRCAAAAHNTISQDACDEQHQILFPRDGSNV